MKKLALALVCLVSVAFFASCDPEEIIQEVQPNIEILTEDGYLQNGDVLDLNEVGLYGFRASSNVNTQAELAKFVVTCTVTSGEETYEPEVVCDSVISGTEFVFEDYIYFEIEGKDIIGSAEVTATITDVDGYSNSTSFVISINEQELLEVAPFSWRRYNGQDGTGLAEYGLKWETNIERAFYAVNNPLEGATLIHFRNTEVWDEVTTAVQKAALFSELPTGANEVEQFDKVVIGNGTHDYVIGTIYNGEYYLIHITKTTAENRAWEYTIQGEVK